MATKKVTEIAPDSMKKKLRHGGALHTKVASEIKKRIELSSQEMATYYSDWDEQEQRVKFYTQAPRKDGSTGKIESKKIIVPFSFMAQSVKLAMLMGTFYANRPGVQLEGRGEEDQEAARLQEMILDAQAMRTNRWLKDFQWFKDAKTYGVGVEYAFWDTKFSQYTKHVTFEGARVNSFVIDNVLDYEGNCQKNIDPYLFLPDPRVSIQRLQDGEFCGHRGIELVSRLKQMERDKVLFNTKKVKPLISTRHTSATTRNDRLRTKADFSGIDTLILENPNETTKKPQLNSHAGITHLFWQLIPKDWELSDSNQLELWHFIMTDNDIVIYAEPEDFGSFPYFPLQPFGDEYTFLSPSESGLLAELEDFASWLLTSHKNSVDKAIYDAVIYDPRVISEKDMSNNMSGKRIKMHPMLNRRIDDVFKQLTITDTTGSHLSDIQFLLNIFELITGVSSIMMGAPTSQGRKSATEVRGATKLATLRIKNEAELYSAQGYMPLNRHMIMMNQSRMSQKQFLRIVGDRGSRELGQAIGSIIEVKPEDIKGNFDLVPFDGSLPIDTVSQAQALLQFAQVATQMGLQLDMAKIMDDYTNLIGIGSSKKYQQQAAPQIGAVLPDEAIAREQQAGNIIPAGAGLQQALANGQ